MMNWFLARTRGVAGLLLVCELAAAGFHRLGVTGSYGNRGKVRGHDRSPCSPRFWTRKNTRPR